MKTSKKVDEKKSQDQNREIRKCLTGGRRKEFLKDSWVQKDIGEFECDSGKNIVEMRQISYLDTVGGDISRGPPNSSSQAHIKPYAHLARW